LTVHASPIEEERTRERRCIVSGEILPDAQMVRFVVSPDGTVVPDVGAVLPGRGLWIKAERAMLDRAIAKNAFSRAAKKNADSGADLAERTERLLVRRMLGDLGLARRAGQLVLGYDNVARALGGKAPPAVLVEASDGSAGGRRKLTSAVRGHGPAMLDCLTSAELSLALGRENVVHAAVKSGRLAERLISDAGRLSGFRAPGEQALDVKPHRHEREE
jgi:predicted RNA-binding protein YlxR (DUF448 family)